MTRVHQVALVSPFPFASLPRVWHWIEPFRGKVADDFAPQTLEDFIAHVSASWKRQKTWGIVGDGELGGLILFERLTPWLGTAHVLLKPDFQGRGVAVKACRAAVAEMFGLGIGKLTFRVLAGNLAIGSLLVNIGARREGTQEAETLRNGEPADVWLYGLTKKTFEDKQYVVSTSGRPADVDQADE